MKKPAIVPESDLNEEIPTSGIRLFYLIVPVLAVLCFTIGCRYTFTTFLPAHIKTIYISPVDDLTVGEIPHHLDAQMQLTSWLKARFLEDNRLRIVDRNRADAILEVDIVRYTDTEKPLEGEFSREIVITIGASFRDSRSGKILWNENDLIAESNYTFDPEEDDRAKGESLAFQIVGGQLVDEILQRVVYGW